MFNPGDIVKIKNKPDEYLVVDCGCDLETGNFKYALYSHANQMFFVLESDLIYVSTLDDELKDGLNIIYVDDYNDIFKSIFGG